TSCFWASSAQDWAAAVPRRSQTAKFNHSRDLHFVCFSAVTATKSSLGKPCPKLSWMLPSVFNPYRHTHLYLQTHSKTHQTSKGGERCQLPWISFC
uniref:Uncharacterized protein n=1 Tax=Cyanoderma ruficeps TaxID=181631 RepID=A0A8C3QQK1_9PASS